MTKNSFYINFPEPIMRLLEFIAIEGKYTTECHIELERKFTPIGHNTKFTVVGGNIGRDSNKIRTTYFTLERVIASESDLFRGIQLYSPRNNFGELPSGEWNLWIDIYALSKEFFYESALNFQQTFLPAL